MAPHVDVADERSELEQVRSHLTVLLNDLNLARTLAARAGTHDVRELLDEALDYTERLCMLSRRSSAERRHAQAP